MRIAPTRSTAVAVLAVLVLVVSLVWVGEAVRADDGQEAAATTAAEAGEPVVTEAESGLPVGDGSGQRPNIVLISTDDMTVSDLEWMPKTRELLGEQGLSFDRALSPHPLCCPARGAILTGQYAQNNGVKSNQDPYAYSALDNTTTLPVWLHKAGYRTAFTGKYLNGFGTKGPRQPGWDDWDATMNGQYAYTPFQMANNGDFQWYYDINNVDYINQRVNRLVDAWAPSDQPFFIWASQVAPHGRLDKLRGISSTAEALPPARFANDFANVQSPSLDDPAIGEDTSEKNSLVQSKNQPTKDKLNTVFRSRIRSLQAVDEGVEQLVDHLDAAGELDNTYIFFTSDNGFLLGEHNLITKNVPYRQSIRVPMLVRGPGIEPGAVREQRALMIDLAPTFADIADATPLVTVDGVSLLPTMFDGAPLRDTVLIQAGPQQPADRDYGWWWRGVTTDRYTYARFFADGLEELYDHETDPAEIDNVSDDPAYAGVLAELRRRTQGLVTCRSGAECSATFGPVPDPTPEP